MQALLDTLSLVGFNWHIALANLVNLAIIFYIAKKYFFAPIGAVLKARADLVTESVEQAMQAETLLQDARKEEQAIIREGRKEASLIREKAMLDRESMLTVAESDISEWRNSAQHEIEKRKKDLEQKVFSEFSDKSRMLVASLVETSLKTQISAATHDAFVARIHSR